MDDDATEVTDAPELLPALARSADAAAAKDMLTVTLLTGFRRTRWLVIGMCLALLIGLGLVADWVHDVNSRSAHNTPLLVCVAGSEQALAKDVRTLIRSSGKAPAQAYKIPASCKLVT